MFYLSATAETDKGADMTRKDYVAIASAISAVRPYSNSPEFQSAIDMVTGALSQVMIEDNARFDRQRFIAATMEGGN